MYTKDWFTGKDTFDEPNIIPISDLKETAVTDKTTTFENLEYKGIYNFNKPFRVKSEKAYILNAEPDIVYMDTMHVILYLGDGRIVNITSDKGRYIYCRWDADMQKIFVG